MFGAFLMIVGATASGQAALITADASTTVLNATVSADAAAVRSFVGLDLARSDLQPDGPSDEARARLDRGLQLLVERGGILHATLLAPDRTVLAADDTATVGERLPTTAGLTRALEGAHTDGAITGSGEAGSLSAMGSDTILREYLPIVDAGQVLAVVALWRDAAPILAQLEEGRIHVVLITLMAALASVVVLFLIFRTAQERLTRQTLELLEAALRDPLTGTLNHGALVEDLARTIEAAGRKGGAIAIALADIDNFGLLNEAYGHPAGDRALVEVAGLLSSELPEGATWGRYGPDEFLVTSAPGEAAVVEPALERVRARLADISLEFAGSERIPVTLSVGVCTYPSNGESVTTLLSRAALTLDEAKASGGDAVRMAEANASIPSYLKTFDVLQGLVIAVDTKDRYTRRHSDDVARYALFLARLLDLDPELRRALYTAGLLHDVGKIGIPDVILRKPAKLTSAEYEIVKQHVALGDMIVRDLPDIELVRAGVRHHHERWDGRGYLDRLAAEEIPLIARILAVGDAFSAMTTTRPYRKGLSVDEALRRLEDAAGTQLDERLVRLFASGIRTAPDAPLPGAPIGQPAEAMRLVRPGAQRVA